MKIGRWTVAGALIFIGLALLLDLWTEGNLFFELLRWWPLLLVSIGVEILLFHRQKKGNLRFDVIGMVLIAFIIIVGAVLAGTQGLASSFAFHGRTLDFSLFDADWEEYSLDPVTLPVDDQNTFVLKNNNGLINVTVHDGKDIVIEPTLLKPRKMKNRTYLTDDFDYEVEQTAQVISMDVRKPRHIQFGLLFGKRRQPVKLDVRVPASFSVDLTSDNGEINIEGLNGNVHVQTDNGKVDVSDIGGETTLKADNGMIKAIKIKDSLEVQTANGMIHIEDAAKNVSARTDMGKIFIESSHVSGDWDVTTDMGKIEVLLPDTASATIRTETDLGNTTSEFPLSQQRKDVVGGTSTGIIGDGRYDIMLRTDAGHIDIKKRGT